MNKEDKKVRIRPISESYKKWSLLRAFIKVLVILLCIIAIAAIIVLIRGQFIDARNYTVSAHSSGKVRIVAITDLHGKMLGNDQKRIVSKVQKNDPDIIVYLGDMVERSHSVTSVKSLVALTKHLTKVAPVFYVDGNHEKDLNSNEPEAYERLNLMLSNLGAIQLENETSQIILDDGCVVNLCGVTTHYYWEKKEKDIVADLRNREGINILLCHYPESVLWYDAFDGGGLDLALCGHTHGGLIRVPFLGGLYAPEWGWWPVYDFGEYPIYSDTDWKHYGGGEGAEYWGTMIISGGLAGEHGVPRINNPMEISVVDIGK